MQYGVCIKGGVRPWQILQQDDNGTSTLNLHGTYGLARLSSDVPIRFSPVEDSPTSIWARAVEEDTGEPIVDWLACELHGRGEWRISMILPVGGLYRIETKMEYEGWDGLSVTRGDMVHHVGVGDVYLISGQSNAAGRSKSPIYDPPEMGVHMLRLSGVWAPATHPMTETTDTKYAGNYENHNPGHSPWLHFGKELKRALNYPIGLVNAAYGGAPLSWWNPAENGALLKNALTLLDDTGTGVRGLLWYQGEAEGYENAGETYGQRFAAFIGQLREALAKPSLPVILVQLSKCLEGANEHLNRQWGLVREAQRRAPADIPDAFVVPANDLALYDFIHISSESNLVIGERCAKAALTEIYGRSHHYRGCEVVHALRSGEREVTLRFGGITNWLNTFGVPVEQLPFDLEDSNGLHHPTEQEIGRDTIKLGFPVPIGEDAVLHGAWRMDIGGVVPWDCMRMPMLSFYGLLVEQEGA